MSSGYWMEIEPVDPAGPTLGHRRQMLKLHTREVEALERLTAQAQHLGDDLGLMRALVYRLQSQIEWDEAELAHDERAELARLDAVRGEVGE